VIFESYGRADATDAASRIKLSLEENGYQVWIDREHLTEDEPDFWHPIEQALKSSEVVIALISPHSRRLEGDVEISPRMSVCHNELIAAVQMDKTVVCVTVVECKPPLAIAHYDPIPFTNWSKSPDAYHQGIQEILYWIEEGLASPQPHRRYSNYVDNLSQDKLSFPEELTATDDFVGREWLIKDKLETWLKSNSRCFVIEAEPGTGKTALVAELVRRNQDDHILAYHFCNAQNKDTVKPERFVRSIAAMRPRGKKDTSLPFWRGSTNWAGRTVTTSEPTCAGGQAGQSRCSLSSPTCSPRRLMSRLSALMPRSPCSSR
jgi:hypothetical protein